MATEYSTLLGLALPVTGELDGTWGDTVNNGITQLIEDALAGTTTLSSDADVTLTTTEGGSNQARAAVLLWTASGTTTRNITAPAQSKAYIVINATGSTQSIVIRGAGPTAGVTVPAGKKALVAWNGSDFVSIASTSIALTTDVTGTLPVANGGTGSTALTLNNVVLGNGTSGVQFVAPGTTGNILTSNGTTWQSSAPTSGGTVTSVTFSGGTTGLSTTGGPITTSGTLTLGGTLVVANGGTGAASFTANNVLLGNGTAAFQAVAPGTSGNVLTSNGTTWASTALPAGGTVTSVSFSGGTTGLSVSGGPITSSGTLTLSGTLAVANGGTGATSLTANYVLLGNGTSAPQMVAPGANGNVLMSTGATWASVTPGVGGTVTSVAVSGGTTGLTTSGGPITTTGTITLGGTLAVANGGTGVTTSTGSGNNVLSTSPTLVTPALGTPSAAVLTNATGLPLTTGVTGTLPVANGGTGTTTSTGTGNVVLSTSPVLVTPQLGTPASGILTNATGLPLTTGITGTLAVGNGGTGATTHTANAVLLGNGTSALQAVAPSTSGNVLTSNGTTWQSTAPAAAGLVLLATATLSSSASFSFSSTYINSTYEDYVIILSGIVLSGGPSPYLQFAGNVSSVYDYIYLESTTSANTNGGGTSQAAIYPFSSALSSNGTLSGVIEFFGIGTSGVARRGTMRLATVGRQSFTTFAFAAGNTLNSVEFYASTMDSGSVRLYGLKK